MCRSAPYFKAALEEEFKESDGQVLELPDDDPVAFSHFQLWLYTGNILESHEHAKDIDWEVPVNIYLFGDVRGIPGLQNEAIDVYIDKYVAIKIIPVYQLRCVYKNTLDGSPLRKLMVDMMTFDAVLTDEAEWFDEEAKFIYPCQFFIDLAKSLYEDRAGTKTKITELALQLPCPRRWQEGGELYSLLLSPFSILLQLVIKQLYGSDCRPPVEDAVSTDRQSWMSEEPWKV